MKNHNKHHSCCHHDAKKDDKNLDLSTDIIYVCPMHPEIKQKTPGNCPICGMALETENISPEEGFDSELSFLKNALLLR